MHSFVKLDLQSFIILLLPNLLGSPTLSGVQGRISSGKTTEREEATNSY